MAVQMPGTRQISVFATGYVAFEGSAYEIGDRAASVLAVISPVGANQAVVRTEPHAPFAITFATDGTIWTAGLERDDAENDKGAGADYFVIRRFDTLGRLLIGAVSRIGTWSSPSAQRSWPVIRSVCLRSTLTEWPCAKTIACGRLPRWTRIRVEQRRFNGRL